MYYEQKKSIKKAFNTSCTSIRQPIDVGFEPFWSFPSTLFGSGSVDDDADAETKAQTKRLTQEIILKSQRTRPAVQYDKKPLYVEEESHHSSDNTIIIITYFIKYII